MRRRGVPPGTLFTTSAAPWSSRSTWPPLGKRTMRLGSRAEREQCFAEAERHHTVALAVQHQDRRADFADAQVGAERVLDQPAHRDEGIGGGADIGGRGEGRVEDDGRPLCARRRARWRPRCQAIRPTARCARARSARRRSHRRRRRRGSGPARSACRSSRHSRDSRAREPGAVGGKPLEAPDAQVERTGIALEIEHHRLAAARGDVPGDQLFTIRTGERDSPRPAASRPPPAACAALSGKYISVRWKRYISASRPP